MKSDVTSKNRISKKREEMSRLDELIKELCPNGVEYKKLGELGTIYNGLTGKNKNDFIEGNQKYITYVNVFNNISIDIETQDKVKIDRNEKQNKVEYGDIIFTASSENIEDVGMTSVLTNVIEEDLYLNSFCFGFRFKTKIMLPSFSKYLFRSENLRKQIRKTANGVTRYNISKEKIKEILVPILPLKIQEEIVRILDDYTKSVEELKEKLNKELIARKKQYSWYRDYLLKFENKVEIVKLGSISELKSGGTPKTENLEYWENGNIPWMSSGEVNKGNIYETEKKITKEGYNNSSAKMLPKNTVVIALAGQGKTRGTVAITRIELCTNQSICGIIANEKLNSDFLYHYLKTQYENLRQLSSGDGTRGGLNLKMLNNYLVPLPPLEVQKRIVEVLDNFEKTCKELNIELSSEIEKKQKEYEFVRNYLLTFEEKSRQAILACELASLRSKQQAQNLIKILQYVYGYVEVRLGDIGSIVRGNGLQKRDFTEEGVGCIHYGQIYTKYGMATEKTISFVEESLAEKLRKVEKGDIIFAVTSENIEDLCKCVVWLGEEEIVTGGHTAILKHNQNSKFLAYYFQTEAFHSQKRKLATGTKVMDVTATKLEEILVPLPPLEEQQRIVDILDRFDRLCNDISEGLPAEIEARQKQYEYYREKLLNFKKL